jgi:ketosteroid isomerase-like protein
MAEEDKAELVRRSNEAYNARDIDAYLDTVSESVVFRSRFSAMDQAVYRGHDDLRRYFAELDEVWARYDMGLRRSVTAGDRVVGLFELSAVGRASNVRVAERPGVVFTVEGGKIVQIEAFPTHAEALEAVGLSAG